MGRRAPDVPESEGVAGYDGKRGAFLLFLDDWVLSEDEKALRRVSPRASESDVLGGPKLTAPLASDTVSLFSCAAYDHLFGCVRPATRGGPGLGVGPRLGGFKEAAVVSVGSLFLFYPTGRATVAVIARSEETLSLCCCCCRVRSSQVDCRALFLPYALRSSVRPSFFFLLIGT